ncbi:hypothetical protein [Sinomonas notoginsengisoli]|uniref:hypothetical protein n=1 Tax=Sinomonas notoginsengisoli TaxID=1457311 RepID=UPI001F22F66D|nr:hypothetical protein [Sinomonas notoginsengisoli]
MPVAMVSYADTRDQYDSVPTVLDPKPAGLILHAASELPDGRVQIVDVWESIDASKAFEQTLFPAFEKAGLLEEMMSREQPVAYETFDLVK